jgi:hypothetical protein
VKRRQAPLDEINSACPPEQERRTQSKEFSQRLLLETSPPPEAGSISDSDEKALKNASLLKP